MSAATRASVRSVSSSVVSVNREIKTVLELDLAFVPVRFFFQHRLELAAGLGQVVLPDERSGQADPRAREPRIQLEPRAKHLLCLVHIAPRRLGTARSTLPASE
jgi:hypothetical protein